ncbi:uncharacterized protein LOC126737459 [Anthonomus grandis grandis]|uniref:uncharacterized protein LOC126737459 n=1 Tax=Anthonomus grandis grandis TaxID=2921223 RepID=UPI0021652A37|nr:uncharacterized protein LOC126737459 [Anthonomus grandis grandis]
MSWIIRVPLLFVSLNLLVEVYGNPQPGGTYHVHHRIHVPQKIKTIYHTKIIKVPEHHHHFHEKEKIIIEKEKPKEEYHHPIILKEEEHHSDWTGLSEDSFYKKKRDAKLSDDEEEDDDDEKIGRLIQKRKIKKRRLPYRQPYIYYRPK